ncbi:MAG: 50S ribosomal protein L32 [Armatimonadota bacterium]
MALPKRKISKWRRDQRRHSAWRLKVRSIISCPRCHEPKLLHYACPSCGFYGNRKVIEVERPRAQAG